MLAPTLLAAPAIVQAASRFTRVGGGASVSQPQPISGVPGFALAQQFSFGTNAGNNVQSAADLIAGFSQDAPWGRINGELQRFTGFNSENHLTLSGGNLIVSYSGTSGTNAPGFGTQFQSTGKFGFRVTATNLVSAGNVAVGLGTIDASGLFQDYLGRWTNSLGVYGSGSYIIGFADGSGPAAIPTGVTFGTGDVVDFVADIDAKVFWIRANGGNWNGAPTANPVTGVLGLDMSTLAGFTLSPAINLFSNTDSTTAAFTGSIISGITSWGGTWDPARLVQPTHVFEPDCLTLTGYHDGSAIYDQYGHIVSGAIVTNATCFAPCIVEFMVQQPAGRGVWPSCWLYDMNTGHNDSSEIDVLESQFNAPLYLRDDRSYVYQYDHGDVGATLFSRLDGAGRWEPYGPAPAGALSLGYHAYSVFWQPGSPGTSSKYVDDQLGVVRQFTWTGPGHPNIIVYQSIGSDTQDWPGPVLPATFTGDNAKFRIKYIRVFTPAP